MSFQATFLLGIHKIIKRTTKALNFSIFYIIQLGNFLHNPFNQIQSLESSLVANAIAHFADVREQMMLY